MWCRKKTVPIEKQPFYGRAEKTIYASGREKKALSVKNENKTKRRKITSYINFERSRQPPSVHLFSQLLVDLRARHSHSRAPILSFSVGVFECVMEIWFHKFVITRNGLAWIVARKRIRLPTFNMFLHISSLHNFSLALVQRLPMWHDDMA